MLEKVKKHWKSAADVWGEGDCGGRSAVSAVAAAPAVGESAGMSVTMAEEPGRRSASAPELAGGKRLIIESLGRETGARARGVSMRWGKAVRVRDGGRGVAAAAVPRSPSKSRR